MKDIFELVKDYNYYMVCLSVENGAYEGYVKEPVQARNENEAVKLMIEGIIDGSLKTENVKFFKGGETIAKYTDTANGTEYYKVWIKEITIEQYGEVYDLMSDNHMY